MTNRRRSNHCKHQGVLKKRKRKPDCATSGLYLTRFCCLYSDVTHWLILCLWLFICWFNSGAPRAKRASGAPWVSKSTHPRKFGNHVTVHRPSVRTTGKPMFNFTLSSSFGSIGKLILHTYCTSMLWSIHSCQKGICWPVSPDRIAGSGVDPSRSSIFLKLSADKLLVFKWSQAQVYFF